MKSIIVILSVLLFSGCAIFRTAEQQAFVERCEKMPAYFSQSDVPGPYSVTCLVSAEAPTISEAVQKTKMEACECGADAVLAYSTGSTNGPTIFNGTWNRAVVQGIKFQSQKTTQAN